MTDGMPGHDVLAFDVHGPDDAPPIVLGSSLGTTRPVWDSLLPLLTERFRVIRYDHLGHGDSSVPDGPYTIERLTAAVLAIQDDLALPRAHHVGLSLGGMIALNLAATAPERVDYLAVICSSAYLPPVEGWHDRAVKVRAGGTAAVADAVVGRWFTAAFLSSAQAKACRDDLLSTPSEGYAGCCEAIAAMDLRPQLGSIRAPTLAIAGAEDPATPVEHARTIADGVRAGGTPADVAVVAGGAHLASVERPDEVGQLLLDHLPS